MSDFLELKSDKKERKKYKWLIIAGIIIIIVSILFSLISIKFIFFGNKEILYSYNIQNLDYNEVTPKIYKIEYKGKVDNVDNQLSISLELKEDGTCNYYSTQENYQGTTTTTIKSNSSYSINENKLSVEIGSLMQIYEPSSEYIKMGYEAETTYENNINFVGELSEKGKFLTIGKLKYSNIEYLTYLEKGMERVLINPTTNDKYKINGEPAFNSYSEYINENKLDLSKYQIINKD